MKKIGLINYGGGNYQSVANVLKHLEINFIEVINHQQIKSLTHIILPGVGSYNNLVSKLKNLELFEELLNHISNKKVFYLGICVGMQILSEFGTEDFKTKGFKLIDGSVDKIPVIKSTLPNIGWHQVLIEKKNSPLFKNISNEEMLFYFAHSYHFNLKDQNLCSTSIIYEKKIVSSVEKENIFGVQFHPEKSQSAGLNLLKNFCNL